MWRRLLVVLAFAAAFAAVSCGRSEPPADETLSETPQPPVREEARWRDALARNPNDIAANTRLAEALLALDRPEEARRAALYAAKLAQAYNNVYRLQRAKTVLGRIEMKATNYRGAEQLFRDSVLRRARFNYHRTDGTHWACAYQGMGELYTRLGTNKATQSDDVDFDRLPADKLFH
ncbi:MAG: hypothetical protein M5R36_00185 [Deltaproteobacteria bacterium]|nr:hypothetical protein [Deltaproteobacteria bacterium]